MPNGFCWPSFVSINSTLTQCEDLLQGNVIELSLQFYFFPPSLTGLFSWNYQNHFSLKALLAQRKPDLTKPREQRFYLKHLDLLFLHWENIRFMQCQLQNFSCDTWLVLVPKSTTKASILVNSDLSWNKMINNGTCPSIPCNPLLITKRQRSGIRVYTKKLEQWANLTKYSTTLCVGETKCCVASVCSIVDCAEDLLFQASI